jgi:hypothetical protein
MGLSKEDDILQGPDKAETGRVSGDPIMRKLRTTLQDGRKKYNGDRRVGDNALQHATPRRESAGSMPSNLSGCLPLMG